MLNGMIPIPIEMAINIILCILIIAFIAYVMVYKENDTVAAIAMLFLLNAVLGVFFCIKCQNFKNYIKENQVNIYMDGELVSDDFNIEDINLKNYFFEIDGENAFLETLYRDDVLDRFSK